MEWTNRNNDLIRRNGDVLRRDPWRETTLVQDTYSPGKRIKKPEPPKKPVQERLADKGFSIDKSLTFETEEVKTFLMERIDYLAGKYNLTEPYILKARKQSNSRTAAYFQWNNETCLINFNKARFETMDGIKEYYTYWMNKGWWAQIDEDKIIQNFYL